MATFDTELQVCLDDCHEQFGNSAPIQIGTPGAMNTTTGIRPAPGGTQTVSAIRSPRRMVPGGAGQPSIMEVSYTVRVSQMSEAKRGMVITDDGQALYVHGVGKQCNDLEWVLFCRTTRPAAV